MDVKDRVPLVELERIERGERDARRAKRLRIIILAMHGYTAPAVARSVGLSRRVCQRWVQRFNQQGLAGLEDQRGNKRAALTPEQQEHLRERLDAGPTVEDEVCSLRGADVQRILAEELGLLRSLATVYNLLHQLGYSYLRPRPRHRKSNPQAQAEFQQRFPGLLDKIARTHPGKRLRVFLQDESRFDQQGTMTNVWAPTGSRPTAVRQTEYEYLWVIGAVCPETGRAEGLLSPRLNTEVINLFLRQFSETVAEDEHVVMIWDGAGFHTSKQLVVPENVTLVKLPPYSPELNPIENLWHYLKSHFWSNRSYANYDELEQAAVAAWQKAALNPELMKTVCATPYLERASST
jgi:transposase